MAATREFVHIACNNVILQTPGHQRQVPTANVETTAGRKSQQKKEVDTPLSRFRHSSEWMEWTHPTMDFTFVGYSRAGDKTAFWVKKKKWFLDAGGMADVAHKPEHVFITHSHSDHCFNLPNLVSSRHTTKVYAPTASVPFVDAFITSSQYLNSCAPDGFPMSKHKVVGVSGKDTIALDKTYKVKVIELDHGVPCVGYAFYQTKSKLKEEYKGLEGQEIGALRKRGVDVLMVVEEECFVFLGDTSASVFDALGDMFSSFPVVFVECTSLYEEDKRSGHVDWSDLDPVVRANPSTTFVLMHFSSRYKRADLREFFENVALPNIMPWI